MHSEPVITVSNDAYTSGPGPARPAPPIWIRYVDYDGYGVPLEPGDEVIVSPRGPVPNPLLNAVVAQDDPESVYQINLVVENDEPKDVLRDRVKFVKLVVCQCGMAGPSTWAPCHPDN